MEIGGGGGNLKKGEGKRFLKLNFFVGKRWSSLYLHKERREISGGAAWGNVEMRERKEGRKGVEKRIDGREELVGLVDNIELFSIRFWSGLELIEFLPYFYKI